jgi:hypothetical protein
MRKKKNRSRRELINNIELLLIGDGFVVKGNATGG